jgi:hypothetical protein
MPMLKKKGFSDIEEAAFVKVIYCVEIIIFNMLNNVLYVTKSLKLKTIKKDHFMAVLQIMKDFQNGKEVMKGGDPVMPSEFFGTNSGRYFDIDVVSAIENHPWADPGLTRTALDATFGGAKASKTKCFVETEQVKQIIEKYQKSEKADFRVSKDVVCIMISCVMSNLEELFAACAAGGKQKKLTMALLYKTLVKNSKRFAHMSYVFK